MMGNKPRPPRATAGVVLASWHQKQSTVVVSSNMPRIVWSRVGAKGIKMALG